PHSHKTLDQNACRPYPCCCRWRLRRVPRRPPPLLAPVGRHRRLRGPVQPRHGLGVHLPHRREQVHGRVRCRASRYRGPVRCLHADHQPRGGRQDPGSRRPHPPDVRRCRRFALGRVLGLVGCRRDARCLVRPRRRPLVGRRRPFGVCRRFFCVCRRLRVCLRLSLRLRRCRRGLHPCRRKLICVCAFRQQHLGRRQGLALARRYRCRCRRVPPL
ncbi:hypothetical protein CC85DRAFT_317175, partial [Cutaneotrichosporon oleaginosum]